jgi:two-component system OmpR family response regulator
MTEPEMPPTVRSTRFGSFAPIVLIVDDEPVMRELYREALDGEAFRVLTAANGQEALALAETSIPELLVTDVGMPRLDGFGLIRALRRLYPDVPVIVITGNDGYRGRPLHEVAAEHGVVATLIKPFELSDLQAAIRSAVPLVGAVTLPEATPHRRVA